MLIYRFFFGAIYYSLSKYYKGWARLEAAKDAVFRANIIHAIFAIIFLDHISSYFLWHHLSSLNQVLSKILSGIIVMTPVTLVHIYIDDKLSYNDVIKYKNIMKGVGNIKIMSFFICYFYLFFSFIIFVIYMVFTKFV